MLQYLVLNYCNDWNIETQLDERGIWGALFRDLSKAFDCLVHDFLMTKLEAYGFTYESLKLINSLIATSLTENIEQK